VNVRSAFALGTAVARGNLPQTYNIGGRMERLPVSRFHRRHAHLVWVDRRDITKIKNAPTGMGGVQVYYGRVPIAALSGAAACGR
jgi:hypothetical protein